jgi:hypothetical protein
MIVLKVGELYEGDRFLVKVWLDLIVVLRLIALRIRSSESLLFHLYLLHVCSNSESPFINKP